MQIGVATMENRVEGLQKIKNGNTLWYSNSTSGSLFEETQNTNSKEHIHLYVHCSVIYNSQDMEATQVPISRWVDKKAVVHVSNEILLSHKKNENLPFVTAWMEQRVLC